MDDGQRCNDDPRRELFDGDGPEAEAARIWEIFKEYGSGLSFRFVARACMDAGIWDDNDLERFTEAGAIRRVKQALKRHDSTGLPRAMAIGRGETAVVKARQLFLFEDYEQVLGALNGDAIADYHLRFRLHQECIERYGRAPEIFHLEGREGLLAEAPANTGNSDGDDE